MESFSIDSLNMKINDSHHLSLLPLKIQIIIFLFASESTAKQTIDYNHNLGFYIGQPVGENVQFRPLDNSSLHNSHIANNELLN